MTLPNILNLKIKCGTNSRGIQENKQNQKPNISYLLPLKIPSHFAYLNPLKDYYGNQKGACKIVEEKSSSKISYSKSPSKKESKQKSLDEKLDLKVCSLYTGTERAARFIFFYHLLASLAVY